MLIKFIVCFIAGIGAGLGTGFAGMSAAAVISPMLITFLDMPAYEAVGIALASDVLASAVSAYTYGKNKNLDIRNGVVMMVSVLCFTMVGSWIASHVPNSTMGSFSVFMTFLLGVKFIVKPVMTTKNAMEAVDPKKRFVQSVICGVMIGKRLGRKEYNEAYAESKKIMYAGLFGGVAVSALLILLAGAYTGLYRVDDSVKELGKTLLIVFALYAPVKVENMILGGGIIRSGGNTKTIMIIDIIGTWCIGIPLCLLAAYVFKWGIVGVYTLLTTEELFRLAVSLIIFKRRNWIVSLC